MKVRPKSLEPVMVRRLKEDIREISGGFPRRHIDQIDFDGLPADTPELALARLLDQYREQRQARLAHATKRKQAEAALLISGLQQRLLSSIEAFARTLKVHRRTMQKLWAGEAKPTLPPVRRADQAPLFGAAPSSDDDRSLLPEEELHRQEEAEIEAATLAASGDDEAGGADQERALLDQMEQLANRSRGLPDARVRHLVGWIREHLCPGAHLPGEPTAKPGDAWTDLRVLIFTEYGDTRRYLVEMLRAATLDTTEAASRIEVFHGPTPCA